MTRILVCGAGDYGFVHRSLNEVNTIYGPVTCVIHSNHMQALAWQQEVSKVQITRHLPILENPTKDGHLAGSRCRDRMFAEGRPNYVIVFEAADKRERGRDEKVKHIVHRAQAAGLQVITYTAPQKSVPRKGRTVDYDDGSDHSSTGGRSGHGRHRRGVGENPVTSGG